MHFAKLAMCAVFNINKQITEFYSETWEFFMEIRESILGNLGVLLGRWSLLGNLGVLLGNWGVNSETLEFYLEIRAFTRKLWSLLENLKFLMKLQVGFILNCCIMHIDRRVSAAENDYKLLFCQAGGFDETGRFLKFSRPPLSDH